MSLELKSLNQMSKNYSGQDIGDGKGFLNSFPAQQPKISVIIPMRNSSKYLEDCLKSVCNQDYPYYEVLIIDDFSSDNSVEIAKKYPVKIISLDNNYGAAIARNKGAEKARGEILVFTDTDVIIERTCLSQIAEGMTSFNSHFSGIVGRLADDSPQENFASSYKNLYMHYTYGLLPEEISVFYTSIAAIKKDTFHVCKGFDPNYKGASIEDMEFGERITANGYKILMNKDLKVRHLHRYSLFELLKTAFKRAEGVTKIMMRKKFSKGEKSTYQSSPLSFRSGIAIIFLCFVSLCLGIIFAKNLFFIAAIVLYLLILGINFPFLDFLRKKKGLIFFLKSCIIIGIDMFAHGLGAFWGMYSFLSGKKY